MEGQVVPLERNLYGHPLACEWERQLEKVLVEHGVFELGMCSLSTEGKGLCLSVCVDDIIMAGKTENMETTWKILMKDVDLEKPSTFL